MKIQYNCSAFILLHIILYSGVSILAQNTKEVKQIGAGLDQFSLKFLAEISRTDETLNLALSPYTVWSLLILLWEGAKGNTAAELENVLGLSLNENKDAFRKLYQALENTLIKKDNPGVTLDISNSLFVATDQQLKSDFQQAAQDFYNVYVSPVNFTDKANAVDTINKHVKSASRGNIINFVKEDDVTDAEVFMTSVLYFRGFWANQFNKSKTTKETFFDDKNNPIGEVDMMHDVRAYPFSLIFNDTATAVELPYKGNNMGMIVILPKPRRPLQSIIDTLAQTPFSNVVDSLNEALENFGDDPVRLYLPKFKITSDLNLNAVLFQMGIKDIFFQHRSNLLGMFNHYLHVSRVIQRSSITVDEEGTVLSSASGAGLETKSPPPRFLANRPFVYIVYNKETNGIIFAGKVTDPNKFT